MSVEAMKLAITTSVCRAQETVVNRRPFAETIVEVLYDINDRLRSDNIGFPLTTPQQMRKIAIVVIPGDCGLCKGFNNVVIQKAEA